MGLVNISGRYYWVKRVPKRYAGFVKGSDGKPIQQVRVALHTDSLTIAKEKAARVETTRLAEWEALRQGDQVSAQQLFKNAKAIAAARGFDYRPFVQIISDPSELKDRLINLIPTAAAAVPEKYVADALLGITPPAYPNLDEVFADFETLVAPRHLQKSRSQIKKWRLPKARTVENFKRAVPGAAHLPVDQITRNHAIEFRSWWVQRIKLEGLKPETANKDFGHISDIVKTWADLRGHKLPNQFSGLRFPLGESDDRPAFTRSWILSKILAPGALDDLNAEARDVFLMMINTGAGASEIIDAPADDFNLDHRIPHLVIAPNGRELKQTYRRRDLPLLGVSLAAARRIITRGGIQRYCGRATSWSNLVNKYLRNNSLKEDPRQVPYSLRHYVENELLAAGVDDRIRADILGHKYNRPSYGDGGALSGRAAALKLIAL